MRIIRILLLVLLLVGCDGNVSKEPNLQADKEMSSNHVASSETVDATVSLPEKSMPLGAEYGIYQLYASSIKHIDSDELVKVNIPSHIGEYKMDICGMLNKDNIIVCLYEDNITAYDKAMGLYNLNTCQYTGLLEADHESTIGVYAYNEKYIVYKSYYKEQAPVLKLLDYKTGDNIEIFKYSKDPNTGKEVYGNYNDLALVNDKLYFDDFILSKDGVIKPVLYEYDIVAKSTTMVKEDYQNPFIYKNTLVAFSRNDNGRFKMIKSVFDDSISIEITVDIRDFVVAEDEIYAVVNSETNEEEAYTIFQLKELINDHVILSTKSPIYELKYKSGKVYWDNFYDAKPAFYDCVNDEINIFDNTEEKQNIFFIKDDTGLILSIDNEDFAIQYYKFSEKR